MHDRKKILALWSRNSKKKKQVKFLIHLKLVYFFIYIFSTYALLFQYERIYNFPQEAFNVRIDEEEEESEMEEELEEDEEREEEVETDEDIEGVLEKEAVEDDRREEVSNGH